MAYTKQQILNREALELMQLIKFAKKEIKEWESLIKTCEAKLKKIKYEN